MATAEGFLALVLWCFGASGLDFNLAASAIGLLAPQFEAAELFPSYRLPGIQSLILLLLWCRKLHGGLLLQARFWLGVDRIQSFITL